jgi:hypothetical protein
MVVVSPPNPESRQIAQYMADLEVRMNRIEAGLRTVQLSNSSIEGAGIAMYDSDGHYRGMIGFHDDGTTAITSVNPQAPPVPRPPQVTPAMGCLVVSHAGDNVNGAANPADFSHLNVYTASASVPGVRTFVGTINPVPGEFVVSDLDYINYVVTVTAVNMGGTESAFSVGSAGTPTHVEGPDLAANSVTATKIAAGSVTATKLEANLVLASRIIAGSPTAARVEMHPTSGLQAFRADGATRTFWIDATSGNFTAVGSISTAFSGTRIVLNPNGTNADTIRLYGNSTQYGSIFADPAGVGVGVFMKGGFTQTGKIGVYDAEGFCTWTDHVAGETWSAFDATSNAATIWAGDITLEARAGYGYNKTQFRFRDYDGTMMTTRELAMIGLAGNQTCLYNPYWDLGLTWDPTGLMVQGTAPAVFKPIIASAFTVSSRTAKKNEKDVVLHRTSTHRAGMKALTAKSWNYTNEWDGTGERPPSSTWTSSEVARDEKGRAILSEEGKTLYEETVNTGAEVQAIPPHISLIAEDVVEVFPELVVTSDSVDGGLLLGTNDTLGIMWNALRDEITLSDSAALKQPRGVSGGSPHGTVIDSMPVPPDAPTSGALLYESNGNLWVVTSVGKRTKLT